MRAYKRQWMRDKRAEPGGRDYGRRYDRENMKAKTVVAKFRKCGLKLTLTEAREILTEQVGRQLLTRGTGAAFHARLEYWSSVLELQPLSTAAPGSALRRTSSRPPK